LGLVGFILLMPSSFRLHHVRLGIDTLIYSAFMIIAGFQSALFAMLSRVYAVQERLYPAGRSYRALFRHINLERGLVVGLLMALGGLASALYAVFEWHTAGFGSLNIEHIARIVIPSGLTITLGIETILFSFFLSTLGINIRHHSTQPPDAYSRTDNSAASG
jgi:hypothetical protein